tara:strand:- start:429 stop:860 length:432 start_codon:yes stop_codon:yes gene_type:complete
LVTDTSHNYSDGNRYWRRPSGDPLAVNYRLTSIDTSEKRRKLVVAHELETASLARSALAKVSVKLQRVFEDSEIGMMLLGSDATINETNKASSSTMGYRDDTLDDINLLTTLHPDDTELVNEPVAEGHRSRTFHLEITGRIAR